MSQTLASLSDSGNSDSSKWAGESEPPRADASIEDGGSGGSGPEVETSDNENGSVRAPDSMVSEPLLDAREQATNGIYGPYTLSPYHPASLAGKRKGLHQRILRRCQKRDRELAQAAQGSRPITYYLIPTRPGVDTGNSSPVQAEFPDNGDENAGVPDSISAFAELLRNAIKQTRNGKFGPKTVFLYQRACAAGKKKKTHQQFLRRRRKHREELLRGARGCRLITEYFPPCPRPGVDVGSSSSARAEALNDKVDCFAVPDPANGTLGSCTHSPHHPVSVTGKRKSAQRHANQRAKKRAKKRPQAAQECQPVTHGSLSPQSGVDAGTSSSVQTEIPGDTGDVVGISGPVEPSPINGTLGPRTPSSRQPVPVIGKRKSAQRHANQRAKKAKTRPQAAQGRQPVIRGSLSPRLGVDAGSSSSVGVEVPNDRGDDTRIPSPDTAFTKLQRSGREQTTGTFGPKTPFPYQRACAAGKRKETHQKYLQRDKKRREELSRAAQGSQPIKLYLISVRPGVDAGNSSSAEIEPRGGSDESRAVNMSTTPTIAGDQSDWEDDGE